MVLLEWNRILVFVQIFQHSCLCYGIEKMDKVFRASIFSAQKMFGSQNQKYLTAFFTTHLREHTHKNSFFHIYMGVCMYNIYHKKGRTRHDNYTRTSKASTALCRRLSFQRVESRLLQRSQESDRSFFRFFTVPSPVFVGQPPQSNIRTCEYHRYIIRVNRCHQKKHTQSMTVFLYRK